MYIKLDIYNERLEQYEKRLVFAKQATWNNSDALVATHIKWKN